MVLYELCELRNQNIIIDYIMRLVYYCFLLLPTVAIMRFSQAAYSQFSCVTPLSVSLVLDAASGTTTEAIVEQITASAQTGDTATGKEVK